MTLTYIYVSATSKVAMDIDSRQYRYMPKSVLELTPVQTIACCTPMTREPLSAEEANQISTLLKALADPVRLRLMSLVLSHFGGEACVCDLTDAFELSQPTISHHLKVLHDVGLLERDKRGVWVYYRARQDALNSIASLISL
jgi:ArsR family transcriptional regulator, arsenate/arsenite/antimonite-responsive transcriptional repressor